MPAETQKLPPEERWVTLTGSGMEDDYLEWEEFTPEAARAAVEAAPDKFAGFIVDTADDEGVFMCSKGGTVYGTANGVTHEWTLHLYRTHGLPQKPRGGLYTDQFTSTEKGEKRRVARGEGLADHAPHVALFGHVDPHDLHQGGVGNCWLISAFAAAAEFPKVVKALCHQQTLSVDGRYDVRLYHPVKETWQVVTVDDSLPVANAQLKYAAMSTDNEIWPCIVEKALAKLFGSYKGLEGNTSLLALKAICGSMGGELISLDKEPDGTWMCYSPHFETLDECLKSHTPWPDGEGEGDKARLFDDCLFELIEDFDETGCVMCCSVQGAAAYTKAKLKRSNSKSGELVHEDGLVLDHAYTLLRAVDNVGGSGFDLIEMRNPWGKGEWTGAWGDNSPLWNKHPEVKRALKPEFKDDGKFWISKEDFAVNFDGISVCMSAAMVKRQTENLQKAQERAMSDFMSKYTSYRGQAMSASYSEQMFIDHEEARELCEKEPHKWVGYVELPESDDEEEEVGVVMLKVGGKLISKGVPPEWIAWMYNAPPADGGPKKKAKRKASKMEVSVHKPVFESNHPPPPWHQLMKRYGHAMDAIERFALAGAEHALSRSGSHAAMLMRQGTIFRPKNVPSRLAPLTKYVPPANPHGRLPPQRGDPRRVQIKPPRVDNFGTLGFLGFAAAVAPSQKNIWANPNGRPAPLPPTTMTSSVSAPNFMML